MVLVVVAQVAVVAGAGTWWPATVAWWRRTEVV